MKFKTLLERLTANTKLHIWYRGFHQMTCFANNVPLSLWESEVRTIGVYQPDACLFVQLEY